MSRRFCENLKEAVDLALVLGQSHDVYVGVAPRQGNLGTKEGVSRLFALWADVDFTGHHTSTSRLEQLQGLSCPSSMLVWSGGGYHPYWFLTEPVQGLAELAHAERIMKKIADGLDGDAVYDRSRILRVPGTFNHKQYEPRLVKLVHHHPEQRHTLDQLEEMCESLPKSEKNVEQGKAYGGTVPRDVLKDPVNKDKRNVTLTSVAGSLRDRGLDEGTIMIVLLEVNKLRCAPPLSEAETKGIARSVSRYPLGTPRYRRSLAKRVRPTKEIR
jgi:putative DNA primase/helicase